MKIKMKEKDVRDIIDIFMKYEFSAHENMSSAIINSQNKGVKQNYSVKNNKPTFKNIILLL